MNFMINRHIVLFLIYGTTLVVLGLFIYQCWEYSYNPFKDVEFLVDYPGASDRHVTFTPVLRSDPSKKIGPTIGADYGELKFRDINGDGVDEVIIETEVPFLSEGSYYFAARTVLKYELSESGTPFFKIIKREELEDEYSESWKAVYK